MNYKSFSLNVVMRLCGILLTMALLIFLIQKGGFWASCIGLGLLLSVQVWWFIVYVEKTHRELNGFFEAVLTDDFTRHSSHKFNSLVARELHEKFKLIQERFQQLRHKHEELVRYYTLLLEKVPVAILIVDGKKLSLANSAAQKLFQRNHLEYTDYLHQFGSQLAQDVQQILPGEQRTSQLLLNKTTTSLSLSAASIQLSDGVRKIVSLNPIQRELDKQEMTAWQNLVQVFTHEIMNSMTPVASLSKTAADLLVGADLKSDSERGEIIADAHQAINVVARRADNLMSFVQAYRRIANPPQIQCARLELQPLLADICQLFHEQLDAKNSRLNYQVVPENITLNADPIQLEQALINLVKNALESIESGKEGEIMVQAYIGGGGNVCIDIIDNGCGIASDKLEQIFVPFYTSKREGTGVGLFLVKQIMQAHAGSVYAAQAEQGGTLVRLIF